MKKRYLMPVLVLIMLVTAAAVPAQDQARIVINTRDTLAPVNPLLFGQNYGPWMNTNPDFVQAYRQARVTLLRFPAGNWGDENDIQPIELDNLFALAQDLNAEVSVQVRLFPDGTPEAAARLVQYANVENQYGFKYWEIGNEPDLYNQREQKRPTDPDFNPDWYNQRFREFTTAMKAVDPNIQIVGPVVTLHWEEWIPAFIGANGDIIDIISWHWYGHGNELSDAQVLAYAPDIERQVNTIRGWWQDPEVNPLGYERPVPPLFFSEYGVSASSTVGRHLGTQIASLWAAEVFGRLANLGVEMAAHFALQGTSWHGLLDTLEDTRPVYGLYQMYTHWGHEQIATQSPDEGMLPVFASRREDGTVAVMVINKDPGQAREAEIDLRGARPAGIIAGWLLDQEGNLSDLPARATGDSYTAQFPPYSITLLIFEAAPVNWLLVAVLGLLLAAVGGYVYIRNRRRRVS